MKPLIVLLLSSIIAFLGIKFSTGFYDLPYAARMGMSAMLLFTAMAHFMFAEGMARMLPGFIPNRKLLVYATGIIEVIAAVGLQLTPLYKITAWLLILFLILIFPANIKAARDKLNFQKGTNDGLGLKYLWFRIPLQLFFIAWIYFFAIKFA